MIDGGITFQVAKILEINVLVVVRFQEVRFATCIGNLWILKISFQEMDLKLPLLVHASKVVVITSTTIGPLILAGRTEMAQRQDCVL